MNRHPNSPHHIGVRQLTALTFVLLVSTGRMDGQSAEAAPEVRLEPGAAAHWSLCVRTNPKSEEEKSTDTGTGAKTGSEVDIPTDTDTDDAAAKPAVVRSEYIVTGTTGRAVTKSDDGKRVEIYMFRHEKDTLLFTWSESAKRVVPYLLDQYVGPEMRFSRRYPGIDWVRNIDYRGVAEYRGRDCHYFSMAPNRPTPAELAARADSLAYDPRVSSTQREAWFNTESGLPVAFRDGGQSGTFKHHEAPKEPVKLPEPYTVALRYYYGAGARPESLTTPPETAPDPPEITDEEETSLLSPEE